MAEPSMPKTAPSPPELPPLIVIHDKLFFKVEQERKVPGVFVIPRVCWAAPKWIAAFKGKHRLRNIGFSDNDATLWPDYGHKLQETGFNALCLGRLWFSQTCASLSLGLSAHCVKPILESTPVMSTSRSVRFIFWGEINTPTTYIGLWSWKEHHEVSPAVSSS